MKECTLKLWDQGWDTEAIVDALGVSQPSLYQWQLTFDQYGSVNRPSNAPKGPERIITQAILTAVHMLYQNESDLDLNELVLWLGIEHNIAMIYLSIHPS